MSANESLSAVLIKGPSTEVVSIIQDFLKDEDGGVVLLGSKGVESKPSMPDLTHSQLLTAQVGDKVLDRGTEALNWQALRVSVITAVYDKYLEEGADVSDARQAISNALNCRTFDSSHINSMGDNQLKNFKRVGHFYIRGVSAKIVGSELSQAAKILGKDIVVTYRFNDGQGVQNKRSEHMGKTYTRRYAA